MISFLTRNTPLPWKATTNHKTQFPKNVTLCIPSSYQFVALYALPGFSSVLIVPVIGFHFNRRKTRPVTKSDRFITFHLRKEKNWQEFDIWMRINRLWVQKASPSSRTTRTPLQSFGVFVMSIMGIGYRKFINYYTNSEWPGSHFGSFFLFLYS